MTALTICILYILGPAVALGGELQARRRLARMARNLRGYPMREQLPDKGMSGLPGGAPHER